MPDSPKNVLDLRPVPEGFFLRVKVTPKASRTEAIGVVEGVLRIKVQAPPVDGAANEAVREFLAKRLGRPRRDVVLERGETSREKTFMIRGVGESEIRSLLS